MAIKVSGTTVIDNSRKFENITSTDSMVFSDFYPNASTITTTINFTTPFMFCGLTGNTTFSLSGAVEGKSAVLCLDLSTTPHAPTFPSEFNWANGTEPTWANYRRWQIHMIVLSNTRVDCTAFGFNALSSTPTESVTLSGTSGSPVTHADLAASNLHDLVMGWTFGSDGNIYKYESIYNVSGSGTYLHTSSQWNNITPSQTYYIRVQNVGGTNNLSVSDSDSINSWIALSTTRTFRVRDSSDIDTYADRDAVIKVEISSTSNGSNIVATGYYRSWWTGTL